MIFITDKTKRRPINLVVSLACLILLLTLSCYAQDSAKEEETLFVAKKAFDDGFYEASLGLLERFLNNYPNSANRLEAELLIGQCYFRQNKFLEALARFEGLLDNPKAERIKDSVLYWIAEVHFKGNAFDKAANYYKTIIKDFPKSGYLPAAYYSLGWCLFQEQRFSEALGYFRQMEEKYPREPQTKDAQFKIVECLYHLKDYANMRDKVRSYLKIYAKDSFHLSYLYFYLAEGSYYLNDFSEAIAEYSKAIAASSDNKVQALSKLGMAWSYLKLKRYQEAQQALLEIKEEDLEKRSLDTLLLGRAVVLAETERPKEAINIYDRLISITDEPLVLCEAYIGKGDVLYSLAEYAEATGVYKEALAKTGAERVSGEVTDKLHYSLAWALLKQGEFKEAIKEFRSIVKTSDDKVVKVSALCQIGDAYQDSGDYPKAQETYDAILKDYPDSLYSDYVQYQLGMTLLKVSNYDAAIISFLSFKRNFPDSKLLDDATYALGLAYFQKQDYNSSREIFQRFQEEFKDSGLKPQALYLLATTLYNLGEFPKAIEVFKNIIRMNNQDIQLVQKAEYEIADCYYQMGDEKEAMARFKVLRSKYPDSTLTAEVMWWLGEYYYRHNDLTLARRYLTSLIQDFPKSDLVADAYYAIASSYQEEEQYPEALENFDQVRGRGRSDLAGQATIAMAQIYVAQDKADLALKAYKDTLQEYPNLGHLIYPKIGDLLFKVNNYQEALQYYRKSLDMVPVREMPGIQLKIAEVLQAEGLAEEAIEEYLKVTYLYSQDTSLAVKALLRVAQIYEDKENFKEAVNIYKRINAMDTEEAKYARERMEMLKGRIK